MITVPNIAKGQEFNLLVQAATNSDVKSLAFDFVYDPLQLEVVRVNEAAFLKQGNAATDFRADPVEDTGRMSISMTRNAGGARGAGAVAVVVLRAVADDAGPTQVSIESAKVSDATGAPINAVLPPTSIITITP